MIQKQKKTRLVSSVPRRRYLMRLVAFPRILTSFDATRYIFMRWCVWCLLIRVNSVKLHFLFPVYLHLIFEKSSLKIRVWWTGFFVYFELDFYCLCSLQNSSVKQTKNQVHWYIFMRWCVWCLLIRVSSVKLQFSTLIIFCFL